MERLCRGIKLPGLPGYNLLFCAYQNPYSVLNVLFYHNGQVTNLSLQVYLYCFRLYPTFWACLLYIHACPPWAGILCDDLA